MLVDDEAERLLATFGVNLEAAVKRSGLTWTELAERLGTSRAALHAIVDGKRAANLRTVARLGAVLGVEPWRLLRSSRRS